MKNLKTQIDSVRGYAYKRLENGDFDLIRVYYDQNIESVRVLIKMDSYKLDLVILSDMNVMYQASTGNDVILFNNSINIPARIKELAEKKLEEFNSKQKELEIKRLEEKLKELKKQL